MSDPSNLTEPDETEELTLDQQIEAVFDEDARRVREIIEISEAAEDDLEPDSTDDSGGEEGDVSVETEGGTSTPPSPEFVEVAGRKLRPEEAQELVEFYEWARANPQVMAGVNAYLSGQYQLVPVQQEETKPEEDDEWEHVDPSIKSRFEALQAEVQQMAAWRQQWVQQQTYEQVVRAQTDLAAGIERFNSRYSLTEDELQTLQNEAAELSILPALIQKHNGDRVAAVDEALETAYWRSETFRQREFDKERLNEKNDAKRKSTASKLSGSSGSVPRHRETPSTPEQRKEAMIREIAEAMQN